MYLLLLTVFFQKKQKNVKIVSKDKFDWFKDCEKIEKIEFKTIQSFNNKEINNFDFFKPIYEFFSDGKKHSFEECNQFFINFDNTYLSTSM